MIEILTKNLFSNFKIQEFFTLVYRINRICANAGSHIIKENKTQFSKIFLIFFHYKQEIVFCALTV